MKQSYWKTRNKLLNTKEDSGVVTLEYEELKELIRLQLSLMEDGLDPEETHLIEKTMETILEMTVA